VIAATTLPAHRRDGWRDDRDDRATFVTLQASRPGEVFRGVAFAPCQASCGSN
jgi:hypothetical protein